MQAQQILEQYQNLCKVIGKDKLPALKATTFNLSATAKTLHQIDEVYAELDKFNPTSGWLDYQSGKQSFIKKPLVPNPNVDKLLNAEVSNGHDASLHIHYNGRGGWIITHYVYSEGGEYLADGIEHFASFSKQDSPLVTLKYLRFWTIQEGSLGMNPVFACFVGFGGKE